MKLKEMKPGQSGKVTGYETSDRNYRQKLLQMGLVRGAEFQVVRMAPLGDPVEISIRGSGLTLRKAEADALEVERM
jgi:ferrous iron transport protein A